MKRTISTINLNTTQVSSVATRETQEQSSDSAFDATNNTVEPPGSPHIWGVVTTAKNNKVTTLFSGRQENPGLFDAASISERPTAPNTRGVPLRQTGNTMRAYTPAPGARYTPKTPVPESTSIALSKANVNEFKNRILGLYNKYDANLLVTGSLHNDGEIVISIECKKSGDTIVESLTYVAHLDLFEDVAHLIDKFTDNCQSTTIMCKGANLSMQPVTRWPLIISGISKLNSLARLGIMQLYGAFTTENKEVSSELEIEESGDVVHSVKFPGYSWINPKIPKAN